jgi:hypothetical protein
MPITRQIVTWLVELMVVTLITIIVDRVISTRAAAIALSVCLILVGCLHWKELEPTYQQVQKWGMENRWGFIVLCALAGLILAGTGAFLVSIPKPPTKTAVGQPEPNNTHTTPPAAKLPVKSSEKKSHAVGNDKREKAVPVAKVDEKPPTLSDLFTQDLPYTLKSTFDDTGIRWQDGSELRIKRQVYVDFQGKTKFVGFYIPSANQTTDNDKDYRACLKLVDSVEQTMTDLQKNHRIMGGPADEMNSLEELTFSGRVLLYHEDYLSILQKADIIRAYKDKNFDVQFRGPDYLSGRLVSWHHQNDPKGKDH